MAKFYVWKARRILWNAIVIVAAVAVLVYVFNVEEKQVSESEQQPVEIIEDTAAIAQLEESEPLELAVMAENVTVRPVPTKFAEYRLEREQVRSRQMELLQNAAYDQAVDPAQRATAQTELQQLIAAMGKEAEIENLLRAKGYIDGVAILKANSATVVVPAELTQEEAAQIGELVNRLTGISFDRITIVDEPLTV
ncbi:MAG: SpoIIIAH-like family protein [Firmicutes bacterium]|jgi:stage III sporulation protein AH|nr:SpoIIIAH-like family protein [Bacillota bacterium]